MSLDADDRRILLDVLVVAQETRDASVRAAKAGEAALIQLRTLNEIVAREVTPLGQFRADLIERLEEHFNRTGRLELEVVELRQWRDEHAGMNGGE